MMKRDLRGRRLLITGASGGIGRCLAEQAAITGARVAVAARSQEKLQELASSLSTRGVDVLPITADVTLEADRARLLQTVVEHFDGLDVLVNNAGVASWGHFTGGTEEILRQVMEVNFFAPTELIRLAVPVLRRGQQPAIVNVASMCGRRGMPAWPEYSASKFALCGLTEALRGEMVRYDIDVLLIVPGLTRSGLRNHLLRNEGRFHIPMDRGLPPEDVARGILRALQQNRRETVLGRDARWMLRMNRFFPRLLDWLVGRRIRKLYARERGA
jgi:short-subunit dehydrogenase